MEKISRIIPSNARTRSVDVSNSQPVRPGAPSWGRPTGRVTRAASLAEDPVDRVTRSTATKAGDILTETPIYNKRAELARAKVVEDLAQKFFETNPKKVGFDAGTVKSEEVLESLPAMERVEIATKEE